MLNIDFSELFFKVKLVAGILSGVFGATLIYYIVQLQKLAGIKLENSKSMLRIQGSAHGGASQSRWEEIMRHIESEREAEWKLAVIEADKLVDNLLKSAGYHGDTMGERLMNIEKGQLLSLDGLWSAHKIRNKLVHDSNYFLRYAEAKQAVLMYEAVLRELNAIP